MKKVRINNKALVHALGGARKLVKDHAAIAEQYGLQHLPEDTVRSWINRGIMKYIRLSEVFLVAAKNGTALDLRDFVEVHSDGKWIPFSTLRLCHPVITPHIMEMLHDSNSK